MSLTLSYSSILYLQGIYKLQIEYTERERARARARASERASERERERERKKERERERETAMQICRVHHTEGVYSEGTQSVTTRLLQSSTRDTLQRVYSAYLICRCRYTESVRTVCICCHMVHVRCTYCLHMLP